MATQRLSSTEGQRHCGTAAWSATEQQHGSTAAWSATEHGHGGSNGAAARQHSKGRQKRNVIKHAPKRLLKRKISCLGMAHAVTCTQSVQVISGLRGSRREDAARRVARGQEKMPAKVPAFLLAL
jgi:hypothetical protein